MKSSQRLNLFGFLGLMIAISLPAHADKMDLDTHTAVIQRLEPIVMNLDDKDASKVPTALRLADLFAERSRLKGLKEVEQNCNNCLKAIEDRRQSLKYYTFVIPRLSGEARSQSLLQKAHLHVALGEQSEAEKIYKQMTKEGKKHHTDFYLGQVHASLGDFFFQKADFKTAKKEFEIALTIKETPQKGLVHYRLAWCLFNLNQTKAAIARMEMILQTPALTEMVTADGKTTVDESFKIDVSKDLASISARTTINQGTIEKLLRLSPPSERQNNLFTLGTESDRLGKKKESALVWMVYLQMNAKDKDALEAQIRLMKLQRDMGKEKESLNTFAHVSDMWNKDGCGEKCDEHQSKIKQWITQWTKEEKQNKTLALTQAYMIYSSIFTKDAEMIFRGAEIAKERKQLVQAFELYRKTAVIAHTQLLAGKKLNDEDKKTLLTVFEGSLIGEIDMSETLKNSEMRLKAYNHYLELHPHGPREFEVRYQIAQTEFERKNFAKSASLFKALALEKGAKSKDLQKSAAHMSIDALIKLKDEETIEKWSLEYFKSIPGAQKEFAQIHRKAVLNITAAHINQKKADGNDLDKLNSVSLIGSTAQERTNLYKNRYLLAVRLQKFPEAKKANQDLLASKDLSNTEREQAWQDRIWLAELELDFKVAYHLALTHNNNKSADSALRLLWLAHMADANPEKHENDFLRLSNNKSLRATVIAGRIQRSKNPAAELKKHGKELSQSPEVLAKLSLEVYGRTNNIQVLRNAFEFAGVRKTINADIIGRLILYPEFNAAASKLAKSNLDAKSDKRLKTSLEARLKNVGSVDKFLQLSIKNKDVVMQAIALDVLLKENSRLYNDIMNLPIPKGLKENEKAQYQALVAEQANPYKVKTLQIENKLNQLWEKSTWSERISRNYIDARAEYQPALRQDVDQLRKHAPSAYASTLTLALSEKADRPSEKEINKARLNVRQNPFEKSYVAELKDLESQRGNDLVAAHLEARLSQLKGITR